MGRAELFLCQLGRRPSRTCTFSRVGIVALVILSIRFGLGPVTFAASLARKSHVRGAVRSMRVACMARGGETLVMEYKVGDTVDAFSKEDGQWYPGRIRSIHDDGTYTVTWDDPDGGPETIDVDAQGLKQNLIFKGYVVGDDCEAEFPDDKVWYPGTVSAVNHDGTFDVTWDDPDGGPETTNIEPHKMKKANVFQGYRHGDYVLAVFPDDGCWYPGIVSAVNTDGTFVVKWDDPDGGPEESEVGAKKMKVALIPTDKLEVGAKYYGTVKSVKDFGAFVDIGAESIGFLHISCINGKPIKNIYNHLQEGQQIEVWIAAIDKRKVRLTMVERLTQHRRPPLSDDFAAFEGISDSMWFDGIVQATADYGALVRIRSPDGSEATGLLHKRQMGDISELKEGDRVEVRVEGVDILSRRMLLTSLEEGTATSSNYLAQFEDLSPSDWVNGVVTTIQRKRAWVLVTLDNGCSATGSVSVPFMSTSQFVNHAGDVVEEGQQVKVRVVKVNFAKGTLVLSMV